MSLATSFNRLVDEVTSNLGALEKASLARTNYQKRINDLYLDHFKIINSYLLITRMEANKQLYVGIAFGLISQMPEWRLERMQTSTITFNANEGTNYAPNMVTTSILFEQPFSVYGTGPLVIPGLGQQGYSTFWGPQFANGDFSFPVFVRKSGGPVSPSQTLLLVEKKVSIMKVPSYTPSVAEFLDIIKVMCALEDCFHTQTDLDTFMERCNYKPHDFLPHGQNTLGQFRMRKIPQLLSGYSSIDFQIFFNPNDDCWKWSQESQSQFRFPNDTPYIEENTWGYGTPGHQATENDQLKKTCFLNMGESDCLLYQLSMPLTGKIDLNGDVSWSQNEVSVEAHGLRERMDVKVKVLSEEVWPEPVRLVEVKILTDDYDCSYNKGYPIATVGEEQFALSQGCWTKKSPCVPLMPAYQCSGQACNVTFPEPSIYELDVSFQKTEQRLKGIERDVRALQSLSSQVHAKIEPLEKIDLEALKMLNSKDIDLISGLLSALNLDAWKDKNVWESIGESLEVMGGTLGLVGSKVFKALKDPLFPPPDAQGCEYSLLNPLSYVSYFWCRYKNVIIGIGIFGLLLLCFPNILTLISWIKLIRIPQNKKDTKPEPKELEMISNPIHHENDEQPLKLLRTVSIQGDATSNNKRSPISMGKDFNHDSEKSPNKKARKG